MNRQEAVQYGVSGIGVIEGADLDFSQPTEFPCDDCGEMVDLTSIINVAIQNRDGTISESQMTEANARALLDTVGIPPPPVMCDRHDDAGPISTERLGCPVVTADQIRNAP